MAVVLLAFAAVTVPPGPVADASKAGGGLGAGASAPLGDAEKKGGGNGRGGERGNGGGQGGHRGDGQAPGGGAAASGVQGDGSGGGRGHHDGGGNGNGNANGRGGKKGSPGGGGPSGSSTGGGTGGGSTGGGSTGGGSTGGSSQARPSSGGSSGGGSTSGSSGGGGGGASQSPSGATLSPASATPSSRTRRSQRRAAQRPARRTGGRTPAERRRARAARRETRGERRGRSAGGRAGTASARLPGPGAAPGAQTAATGTPNDSRSNPDAGANRDDSAVVRTIRDVVEVIPGFIKAIIGALAVALLIASVAWFLLARNARFLRRQREKLVGEIGVLQGALLPNVPPELNRLEASVAYRPAEGLAAGGDFYDAFPLDSGRVGIVVGDVAGHGKEALMHTALLRYTMRAYLEAGLEPRAALQVAGRVLDRGFDTLATVVLAIYDPSRHVLRYATAGHPPPVFLGEADHVPVTRASSPPIGAMMPTGLRQTTVSLPAGSAACFFTDGLIEARRDDKLIGRLRLVDMIRELGPHATAAQLLDRVAAEADVVGDDMAACMFRVSDGPAAEDSPPRVEELELRPEDTVSPILTPFLEACGLPRQAIHHHVSEAERTIAYTGGAVVRVAFASEGPHVDIAPANVESLAAAHAVRVAL